jgi:putative ubiquitin-RnfH superfamily antitoxin RatB of RatAB toxin-antitoxin module
VTGASIRIAVALAEPDLQSRLELDVPVGTTVEEAIALSGIAARHPLVNVMTAPVGIFGLSVPRSQVLQPGDRVELYLPLRHDPKRSRREAARRGRSLGGRR